MLLVHSYFTNGFLPMAEVFLKSLLAVSKPAPPRAWLDTRGLTGQECEDLKKCYAPGLLHIENRAIPMREWAERAGVSVGVLRGYKKQCEQRYVRNENRVWKLMTAGDDRVAALYDVVWGMPMKRTGPQWKPPFPSCVAHFDIDTLFRHHLNMVPGMMEEADIWLKLRRGHPTLKARITIDTILLNGADNVQRFFERWRVHINRVPPAKRPVGWGQASCWHAFLETEKKLRYGVLPLEFGLPGRNKQGDYIWTGNVHRLAKSEFIKLCRKEMGRWRG